MLWIAWFVYWLGVAPTWCFLYEALRSRGRLSAWATASGVALIWPAFLWQHRRWERNWVNDLERELHDLTAEATP